MTFVIG